MTQPAPVATMPARNGLTQLPRCRPSPSLTVRLSVKRAEVGYATPFPPVPTWAA
jgi:hypothetical protein